MTVLPEAKVYGVPVELTAAVSTLVVQLRRLRPILGDSLESAVAATFETIARLAIEAYKRPPGRDVAEEAARLKRRNGAKELLTLRGFMIVWCASGRPFPEIFPELIGLSRDPSHPIVRNGSLVAPQVALGFLRERAWVEAENDLHRRTNVDRDDVLRFLAKAAVSTQLLLTMVAAMTRSQKLRHGAMLHDSVQG